LVLDPLYTFLEATTLVGYIVIFIQALIILVNP
jgi:hypothetical protein